MSFSINFDIWSAIFIQRLPNYLNEIVYSEPLKATLIMKILIVFNQIVSIFLNSYKTINKLSVK